MSERSLLTICKKAENKSLDGTTIKYLLRTNDNNFFESVLLFEDMLTLCISSQIGCNVKCKFCVTGQGKFRRNLTSKEIIEQMKVIENDCRKKMECVSFMGMGEPTLNLDNVIKSMKFFYKKRKKIKLSTVGIPGTIKKLANINVPFDLFFSLHIANKEKRKNIIPLSRNYNLDDIINELNYFARKKNDGIIIWYLMLSGINDRKSDMQDLIKFLEKIERIKLVYVKDYCESGNGFQKAEISKMYQLANILNGMKIPSKVSVSKGQTIDAGCGQLRQRIVL